MGSARKAEAIVIIFLIVVISTIFIGKSIIKIPKENIKSEDWNVSFKKDTAKVTDGSVKNAFTILDDNNISFETSFSKTYEFYEASVVVENKGNLDAYLKRISLKGLTKEQEKYLTYSFAFGENDIKDISNGFNIKLPSKSEVPFKIKIEYKNPYYGDEVKVSATVTLDFESE